MSEVHDYSDNVEFEESEVVPDNVRFSTNRTSRERNMNMCVAEEWRLRWL